MHTKLIKKIHFCCLTPVLMTGYISSFLWPAHCHRCFIITQNIRFKYCSEKVVLVVGMAKTLEK